MLLRAKENSSLPELNQPYADIILLYSEENRAARKDFLKNMGAARLFSKAKEFAEISNPQKLKARCLGSREFLVIPSYRLTRYWWRSAQECENIRKKFSNLLIIDNFSTIDTIMFSAAYGASMVVFPAYGMQGMTPDKLFYHAKRFGVLGVPYVHDLQDISYIKSFIPEGNVLALSKENELSPQDIIELNYLPFALEEVKTLDKLFALRDEGYFGTCYEVRNAELPYKQLARIYRKSEVVKSACDVKSLEDLAALKRLGISRAVIDVNILQELSKKEDLSSVLISAELSNIEQKDILVDLAQQKVFDSIQFDACAIADKDLSTLLNFEFSLIANFENFDDSLSKLHEQIKNLQVKLGERFISVVLDGAYVAKHHGEFDQALDPRFFLEDRALIIKDTVDGTVAALQAEGVLISVKE